MISVWVCRVVIGFGCYLRLAPKSGNRLYRLNDRVRCTGRVGRTPSLVFLGREGEVCDLVGEKLYGRQIEQALQQIDPEGTCDFAMLAPAEHGRGYQLFLDAAAEPRGADLASALDKALHTNYHYAHARAVGQLAAIVPAYVKNAAARHRSIRTLEGTRAGATKPPALDAHRDWVQRFGLTQG